MKKIMKKGKVKKMEESEMNLKEEKILEFLENAKCIKKELCQFYKSISIGVKKCDSLLVQIKKSMKCQEEVLRENCRHTANVDESLGNVLLAIRQNEYLQAWHPAQHGFPEMKVAGKHPAKKS